MYGDGDWTKIFLSLSSTSTCALWGGTPYRGPNKNYASFWKTHREMYCKSGKESYKIYTLEDAGFHCTKMSYTGCTTHTHGFEAGRSNPVLERWGKRLAPPPKYSSAAKTDRVGCTETGIEPKCSSHWEQQVHVHCVGVHPTGSRILIVQVSAYVMHRR